MLTAATPPAGADQQPLAVERVARAPPGQPAQPRSDRSSASQPHAADRPRTGCRRSRPMQQRQRGCATKDGDDRRADTGCHAPAAGRPASRARRGLRAISSVMGQRGDDMVALAAVSWARLCSLSAAQPKRSRTGPVATIAAWVRFAGRTTSVRVSRPRRRRKPDRRAIEPEAIFAQQAAEQAGAEAEQDQHHAAGDDRGDLIGQRRSRRSALPGAKIPSQKARSNGSKPKRVADRLGQAEQAADHRQREVEHARQQHAAQVHGEDRRVL